MTFRIADLAEGIWRIDGESELANRRLIPIPRFNPDFDTYVLPYPQRIDEVSISIYGDSSMWSLIAEWNSIPRPARYFFQYLPLGYEIKYMSVERYQAYYEGSRFAGSFNGAGEIDLTVEIQGLTGSSPSAILDATLENIAAEFESSGINFVTLTF